MAKTLILDQDTTEIEELIVRGSQSGNINFLLGSGASMPALAVSGPVETEINALFKEDKEDKNTEAHRKLYDFITGLLPVNNALLNPKLLSKRTDEDERAYKNRTAPIALTKAAYSAFLSNIEYILERRRTNILRKHANIFTTNYDLFIEDVSDNFPALRLNDGFFRSTSLRGHFYFSTQGFFNTVTNCGNLYNYKAEIPSVNLVKIHGSLSWKRLDNNIACEMAIKEAIPGNPTPQQIKEFNESLSLILPQQGKFRETLLDRWYYELLRIYSNELDKEGTVLFVFGFSFGDEHIQEITKRALRNASLLVLVFAYNEKAATEFADKFGGFNNVIIVKPATSTTIEFIKFNEIVSAALKRKQGVSDEN